MNILEPCPEFLTSQKLNIPSVSTNVLLPQCVQQFWFQSSSDQNIGIWERARNMPSCQLYRSVSEVPPDNPPRLLQSCVLATGAGWHISCQSRAQNSIVCSNSIMCTKQFVIYTPHTLSRAFFAPQDFVASLHCISPLSSAQAICSLTYLRCLNDEADSI